MVYIYLATGFEEVEAVTILDLIRRAGIEAKFVSITGEIEVVGAHGITISADALFEDMNYENCKMIILPGGMPGTINLAKHVELTKKINSFAKEGKYLAAICAAPMILGQMGLLEGKRATIYTGMEKYLDGAVFINNRVVTDGNVITSQGPGTAMEFAIKLVEILKDEKTSKELRRSLVL